MQLMEYKARAVYQSSIGVPNSSTMLVDGIGEDGKIAAVTNKVVAHDVRPKRCQMECVW